jgi:hypothetical protein
MQLREDAVKLKRMQALQLNVLQILTSCVSNEIEKLILNTNDSKIIESLKVISDFCKDPFKGLNFKYKMLNYLESKNVFRKPSIITLDNKVQNLVLNNINTIDTHKMKVELPGILDPFLDYTAY